MPQLLHGRAQFVAEVAAARRGELVVERVIRGVSEAKGRSFRIPENLLLQPLSCCDRGPYAVKVGEKYWAIAPEQPRVERNHLEVADVQLLKHDDARAKYLANLHDVTPAELRALLNRWRVGAISSHKFAKYIEAVDVPGVSACIRGYYQRLLMSVTYMAWGNENHSGCDVEKAGRVRVASAKAALGTLSFIQNEGAAGRLVCSPNLQAVTFMSDPLDQQIRATQVLYPCNPRANSETAPYETGVMTAALESYFNQMYGGPGRRFLLYFTTVRPSRTQMEVRVFSPANAEATRQYASADMKKLRENLLTQSASSTPVHVALPRYVTGTVRLEECDEFRDANFEDSFAVSRPAFKGSDEALIYLEHAGGARAYHVIRRDGRWAADWWVELWACG